jgi:DNA polymerase elongation subunit (family B)
MQRAIGAPLHPPQGEEITFFMTAAESVERYNSNKLRLVGPTKDGVTVAAILDFTSYFYMAKVPGDLDEIRQEINQAAGQAGGGLSTKRSHYDHSEQMLSPAFPELVTRLVEVQRENVRYHKPRITPADLAYFRVEIAYPMAVKPVRDAIYSLFGRIPLMEDNDITHPMRYLIDQGLSCCTWLTIPVGQWNECPAFTHCRWNVEISSPPIIHSPSEDKWAGVDALRVVSIDIECVTLREGSFPDPHIDPVCMVSFVTYDGDGSIYRRSLVVGNVARPLPDPALKITSCVDEVTLFQEFIKLWRLIDADIITGYNIEGFDLPYLFTRAEVIGVHSFKYLGRIRSTKVTCKERTFGGSKGKKEYDIRNFGVVFMDMLKIMQTEHKFRSYSLNSVALAVLGETKEDVHHSLIPRLARESDETRQRLVIYCDKDALLPVRLMIKKDVLVRYAEICRVTYLSLDDAFNKKQQIRCVSLLTFKGRKLGRVMPFSHHNKGGPADFTGGLVLEPERGFYDETNPVAVLDFNSLYPNAALYRNFSYDTLLLPQDLQHMDPADYYTSDTGHSFVKQHVKVGIVPLALKELLDARSRAKKVLKGLVKEYEAGGKTDNDLKNRINVFNGRQLALKISANSIYGFTGFQKGALPEMAVSSSITSEGRKSLQLVKEYIEKEYKGTVVAYGDSVTGDTPCLVRDENGQIDVVTIDSMGVFEDESGGAKDYSDSRYEVWTEHGWTKVVSVMRHRVNKPIVRIVTPTGVVDCTEDHGLVSELGARVSPGDVDIGDKLLHAFPDEWPLLVPNPERISLIIETLQELGRKQWTSSADVRIPGHIFNSSIEVRKLFYYGVIGVTTRTLRSKQLALGLYTLARSIGLDVLVAVEKKGYHIYEANKEDSYSRTGITHILCDIETEPETFVYDLETDNHHFHAGVGQLIVHNTDSVMVRTGHSTVPEALDWMYKVGPEITEALFPDSVMNLAPEKVFCPWLLINKKKYAGLYWTKPDKPDMIYSTGLENVRRDNFTLVQVVMDEVLERVLMHSDHEGALQVVRDAVEKLYLNTTDMDQLIVSKQLKQAPHLYKNPQPHSVLAQKLERRQKGAGPRVGDRVPYVMVGGKNDASADKAEDPLYVLEKGIPLDQDYYVRMLRSAIERILLPVVGPKRLNEAFCGDHTSRRVRVTPKVAPKGSIMAFMGVKKQKKCAKCRNVTISVKQTGAPLCEKCKREHGEEFVAAKRIEYETAKEEYDEVYKGCQICQGNPNEPVLCMSKDCKILYKRRKRLLRVEDLKVVLDW